MDAQAEIYIGNDLANFGLTQGLCAKYNLILEEYSNQPPEVYTNYIEVPGRDGLVDMSEADGRVHYKNRKFTLLFHAFDGTDLEESKIREIKSFLHGKVHSFRFNWDINVEYRGRFHVSVEQPTAQDHQLLSIVIDAEPFGKLFEEVYVIRNSSPLKVTTSDAYEYAKIVPLSNVTVAYGQDVSDNTVNWSVREEITGETVLSHALDPNKDIRFVVYSSIAPKNIIASTYDTKTITQMLSLLRLPLNATWQDFYDLSLDMPVSLEVPRRVL